MLKVMLFLLVMNGNHVVLVPQGTEYTGNDVATLMDECTKDGDALVRNGAKGYWCATIPTQTAQM